MLSASALQTDLKNWFCRSLAEDVRPRQADLLPSEWAEKYVVLPKGPLRFDSYPFLRAMHDDMGDIVVVAKGAQVGVSTVATNRTFYTIDHLRTDVLYVFPTASDAGDFSSSRFDPILENSPHLRALFDEVKNVGHKRAGSVNLFVRGSHSRSKLKSIAVGMLVLDEFDEMNQDNVVLARERLSGHVDKVEWRISTPTLPGYGIWKEILETNRQEWFVSCFHCGKRQFLRFEANLEWKEDKAETARFRCAYCKKPWGDEERRRMMTEGGWVPTEKGKLSGYHISQLYSPTITAEELVDAWLGCQGDEPKKQEFHNSKLGEPYIPEGAKLDAEILERCRKGGFTIQQASVCSTMGVDVTPDGRHYAEIAEWHRGHKRVLNLERPTWGELDSLMKQYGVVCCVIDANPERRDAREFVQRWKHRAYMAFYPVGLRQLYVSNDDTQEVKIERSESLDRTLGRFRTGTIHIPQGLQWWKEYSAHLQAPVRTYMRDKRTRVLVVRYPDTGEPDHWAHASNYNEIAGCIRPYGPGVPTAVIHEGRGDGTFAI